MTNGDEQEKNTGFVKRMDSRKNGLTPGVKIKFGRVQVYRYKNRIQEPKNPFEKAVRHWGRDRHAQVYRYGPIPRELLVVTTGGVRCTEV